MKVRLRKYAAKNTVMFIIFACSFVYSKQMSRHQENKLRISVMIRDDCENVTTKMGKTMDYKQTHIKIMNSMVKTY